MKDRLLIVDLDGTLYNTGRVNFRAYQKALDEFHIPLEEGFFLKRCDGLHYREFLPLIAPDLTEENMETVHRQKQKYYSEYLEEASVNELLVELVWHAREGFYTAVVTTASRVNARQILDHFGHLSLFDFLCTQEDVKKKKPDPEGYILTMERFGVNPEKTLIFEDSEPCIESALATGAGVFRAMNFVGAKGENGEKYF